MVAPVVAVTRENVRRTSDIFVWPWIDSPWPYEVYYGYATGFKQAKPIDRVLEYERRKCNATYHGTAGTYKNTGASAIWSDSPNLFGYWQAIARNQAYERFKSQALSTSQVGASLAEFKSSRDMIADRATQLLRAAKALRKRDFRTLKNEFGWNSNRVKNANSPKTFGKLWLEFHFGWEPMVKDIYEAAEVFVQPVKSTWASGSATSAFNLRSGSSTDYGIRKGFARCKMGGQIAISNPNVALANQLGLLNPAQIAWELVPFSFAVDWFVNVGQMLGSTTDFMGTSMSNTYTTTVTKWGTTLVHKNTTVPSDNCFVDATSVHMQRSLGIAAPTLRVSPIKTPSLTRALTQISLLVGFLGNQR